MTCFRFINLSETHLHCSNNNNMSRFAVYCHVLKIIMMAVLLIKKISRQRQLKCFKKHFSTFLVKYFELLR